RTFRPTDAMGIRARGDAAGRSARDVRDDDEELPSWAGGAERPHGGAAGEGEFHEQRRGARSKGRLGPRAQHDVRLLAGPGPGRNYAVLLNRYKPFACGVVLHPIIDACLQLRAEHHLTPEAIGRIDLRVNPLVLELTGKRAPKTGLEGKFSVYFAAAVAIAA